MLFGERETDSTFPPFLADERKDRLKRELGQFFVKAPGTLIPDLYNRFYEKEPAPYFLQGDIVLNVPMPVWSPNDQGKPAYRAGLVTAILLSNSCDISEDNIRGSNIKQSQFAPLTPYPIWLKTEMSAGRTPKQIEGSYSALREQGPSNLFYLPPTSKDQTAYIANLDRAFWLPTSYLLALAPDIENSRLASLTVGAHYLFLLKVLFHFGRLPEESERGS